MSVVEVRRCFECAQRISDRNRMLGFFYGVVVSLILHAVILGTASTLVGSNTQVNKTMPVFDQEASITQTPKTEIHLEEKK